MEKAPTSLSPELVVSPIPETVNARELCRLWRQAICDVRGSAVAAPQQLPPWVVLPDGRFLTCTDGRMHFRPASFPANATCIGSTDRWLALVSVDGEKRHSYMLYDPFSETTVPLPELDAIIGVVPKSFKMRKVLMRSTPDDLVVLMPNNVNYPIVLVSPGKGVWMPQPRTAPFTRIIDVAFLGDVLYGITEAEDLFALDIAFDADGVPMVTDNRCVIKHSTEDGDSDVRSNSEGGEDEDEDWTDVGKDANEEEEEEEEEDEEDYENGNEDKKATIKNNMFREVDLDEILDGSYSVEDDGVLTKPKDLITTTCYLVESRGKVLMVKRKLQVPPYHRSYTRRVEVFEADMTECVWVPVANELGGHTLFIGKPFSKSVPAVRESEEDAIHFIDTRDTFNMRFQITIGPHYDLDYCKLMWSFPMEQQTWLFPPEAPV